MKSISILGSTGSIGNQALEVIKEQGYKVKALSCNGNTEIIKEQINSFSPEIVAVFDEKKADLLESKTNIQVLKGMSGLKKIAKEETDIVLNALVGSIGIEPTIEAINAKNTIALANKETLVAAGSMVMDLAKKNNVQIIPIDSEHSAVFQCAKDEELKSITLTCSGGPFRNKTQDQLKRVKKEDALKHPNWDMGAKITIDSATLMNKGLEVIEAHHLFNLNYDDINVVIHPESIIHSLVECKDTSVLAQLGWPDMRLPIQYALTYPKRQPNSLKPLDLGSISSLNFSKPNTTLFPCLHFAYEAAKIAGSMPAVMNAANEVAVKQFQNNEITFTEIPTFIKNQMDNHSLIKNPDIDDILKIDQNIKKL